MTQNPSIRKPRASQDIIRRHQKQPLTQRGGPSANYKTSQNFIEYKGSPYKNSSKKIQIPGLNIDLKGTTPERVREDGNASK
jgi:hypothetical protein